MNVQTRSLARLIVTVIAWLILLPIALVLLVVVTAPNLGITLPSPIARSSALASARLLASDPVAEVGERVLLRMQPNKRMQPTSATGPSSDRRHPPLAGGGT